MFVALDKNNNRVSIENAVKDQDYFCPSCGEPLIIKALSSVSVKPHFAHKKGADCDSFSHDMSEWHFNWQQQFPLENREVVVEKDGIKHRADVLIGNTVIEFQHSHISPEEIAARNDFYLSIGYNMVWVFDANGQIKNECGESTDPVKARPMDLCWRRKKNQFSNPIPRQVKVFIQYKTDVSIPQLAGRQIDIMLLLDDPEPKYISFHSTRIYDKYFYITPSNFLKEYGGNVDEKTISISDILTGAKQYQNWLTQQKRAAENRRANMFMNALLNRRGRRR